jgi:hypothetical protein
MKLAFALVAMSFPVGLLTAFQPPVKEEAKPDYDKLAIETVEKMLKAMADGKTEDAIKLMGFPFRDAAGELITEKEMAEQLDQESVALKMMKVSMAGVATVETLAAWAKKEKIDLQAINELDKLKNHAGKDVRLVIVRFEVNKTNYIHKVFLVKPEKNEVKIVGSGR